MMSKLLAALFSSLLICLVAAYLDYTPMDVREVGVSYYSYFRLFIVGWIIIFPMYLVLGIPLSLIMDGAVARFFYEAPKGVAFCMKPISYLLASVAAGWLFSLLVGTGGWNTYKYPFMLGALLFWGTQEIIRLIGRKLRMGSNRPRRTTM
ncbi:MAG: hypothetical protein ACQEXX_05265 [Bacillota bacterium]